MSKQILFFAFIALVFCELGRADISVTQPQLLSSTATSSNSVFSSFDPSTGNFLATWVDGNTNFPTYAFYIEGSGWQATQTIAEIETNFAVITAYIPTTQQFIALWADNNFFPNYSIYTPGSGWSTSQIIPNSSSINESTQFSLSFNSEVKGVIATWGDGANSNPIYAIYTTDGSWSDPAAITTSSTVNGAVACSYNPATGQTIAVWPDASNGYYPTYSIYTPNTPGWSVANTITTDSSVYHYSGIFIGAPCNIYLSSQPSSGITLASWKDNDSSSPAFSFYTPGTDTWSTVSTIPSSPQLFQNVTTVFNPITKQFLALWQSADTTNLTYSLYTEEAGWSGACTITTNPIVVPSSSDLFSSINPITGKILATWEILYYNAANGVVYCFFQGFLSPATPTNFRGVQKNNNFGTVSEYYNTLSWTKASGITSYQLYRNGELIATLSSSADSYVDHNQPKDSETYSLIALTDYAASSAATTVVGGR